MATPHKTNPHPGFSMRTYERNPDCICYQNEVCQISILSIHCVYEVFSHIKSLILDKYDYPILHCFLQKSTDVMRHTTATTAMVIVVPTASAAVPMIEFPMGAVPRNTNE